MESNLEIIAQYPTKVKEIEKEIRRLQRKRSKLKMMYSRAYTAEYQYELALDAKRHSGA